MYITGFSRIDTTSWPGRYLSVVRISGKEGIGENIAEIANTIRGDKDSIDAVLLIREDGDPECIEGIHHFLKDLRIPSIPTIMVTSGFETACLDDLVGAGYIDRVAFRFEGIPGAEQMRSLDAMRSMEIPFCVCPVLNSKKLTGDEVEQIAERTQGHDEFILLVPREPAPAFKKKELNALAKRLKGVARNVRVMSDVKMP